MTVDRDSEVHFTRRSCDLRLACLYTMMYERVISPNPGDDIVKDGQRWLIEAALGFRPSFEVVNRNHPYQVYSWGRRISIHGKIVHPIAKIWQRIPNRLNRLFEIDVLFNASGPLLFGGDRFSSVTQPWFDIVFRNGLATQRYQGVFLNLAMGSLFPPSWSKDRIFSDSGLNRFGKLIADASTIITYRDGLAQDFFDRYTNLKFPLLPCPSLFAKDFHRIEILKNKFFLINYHPSGNRSDPKSVQKGWKDCVGKVIQWLKREGIPYRFIYHEELEFRAARRDFGDDAIGFLPASIPEFLAIYGSAIGGLLNRVHGAYAMASFGKRPILVGSDSRLAMGRLLNLPTFEVSMLDWKSLEASLRETLEDGSASDALLQRIHDTKIEYLTMLRAVFAKRGWIGN